MIGLFATVSWAQRGIYAAVVAALSAGAVVFATLILLASALNTGQGDPGSLAMIGAIAAACTIVVLDAITRHGISERWPALRRLRIIGLGSWSLRGYLAGETAVLALIASVIGYAAALVLIPALVPYLSAMGIVPAGVAPGPSLGTAALVAAATTGVALVAASGAARRAARREPVSVGLVAEPSALARRLGIAFTTVLAALAGLGISQALGAVSTQAGFLWGMLATVSLLSFLGRIWRSLAGKASQGVIAIRPHMSAPAMVSSRWTTAAGRATTPAAVMLAIGLCVFFVGFAAISEHAAKDRLSQVLAGTTVLTHSSAGADPAALDVDGNGVVLTQTEVAVEGSSYLEPAQVLTSADAETFLGPYLPDGANLEGPGVVVTASSATETGLEAGQTVALDGDEGPTELPILAVATVPSTLGDLYLIDDTLSATSSGPMTVITTAAPRSVPAGWQSAAADEWIADLPPGAAVSATGGQGTSESPLLIGAPIALALALAISSTAITTLARREDITQLGRLGMSRTATLTAVARQALALTVPPALAAWALGALIVTAATTPYTSAVGVRPLTVGPLDTYLLLTAVLVLSVATTAIATARTALYHVE